MTDTYQQKESINVRQFADSFFLVDANHGLLHELNDVGARIWELCNKQQTHCELTATLVQEFEVSEEEASKDVSIFLQELLTRELLITNGNNNAI